MIQYKSLRPLYNRIVVKPIDNDSSAGMLKMPDSVKERPSLGIVFSVGDGTKDQNGNLIPLITKVGDTVLFQKYSGTEIEFNNEKYLLMKEDEVQAILGE